MRTSISPPSKSGLWDRRFLTSLKSANKTTPTELTTGKIPTNIFSKSKLSVALEI